MDPSVEEPEESIFNIAARSQENVEPCSPLASFNRLDLNETRSPLRKPVFQHDSSDSDSWETDSSVEEDEAAGVLKRLLKPNPIDLGNFKKDGVPENGSQYLLTVMKQAKKEPKFVKAPLSQEDIEKKIIEAQRKGQLKFNPYFTVPEASQDVKPEPSQMSQLPTREWETQVISKFSALHSKVDRWRTLIEQNTIRVPLPENVDLPDMHANMKWLHFFFGSKVYGQIQSGVRRRIMSIDKINIFFQEDIIQDLGIEKLLAEAAIKAEDESEDQEDESEDHDSEDGQEDHDRASGSDDEDEEYADASEAIDPSLTINKNTSVVSASGSSSTSAAAVIERHHPQMTIMLNIGQRSLEQLVNMNLNWLKHYGWVHELQGEWLYAMLVCLQKPLEASVMADLRDIAKICRKTRAVIWKSQLEHNEDSSAAESRNLNHANIASFLNTMNLFISLVGNYFQQRDLADTLLD